MLKVFRYPFAAIVVTALLFSSPSLADSLLLGFNTQTPLQVYSTSGSYQQDFGPSAASGGIEENGLLYVIQPNTTTFSSSTITAYNSAQQSTSSFIVPYLISDGAPGAGGTLWLAGYNGMVYQVSTTGSLVSSFNTGFDSGTSIGIASNGTDLFTTEGDTSDGIDERSTSGDILATVHTGHNSLYGLGWDSANSTFYAGSFNSVYALSLNFSSLSATLDGTLNIPGDSRTPDGALHDGLEVVDLSDLVGPAPPPPPPPPSSVPEPALGWFCAAMLAAGAACLGRKRKLKSFVTPCSFVLLVLCAAHSASAAVTAHLSFNTSSVPVGETIVFTASASDSANSSATFAYQFNVRPSGTAAFSVVKDFYKYNTFDWTPTSHEGSYDIQVVAKSSTGATGSAIETVTATSRVTGSSPVVNSTPNSLVALYSAPACSSPKTIRVRFQAQGDTSWQMTPTQTCNGYSANFYIAGMRASTTYILQQDLFNGPFDTPGPQLSFHTGTVPSDFPTYSPFVIDGAKAPTNTSYPIELRLSAHPFASDLEERVLWYLPLNFGSGYLVRNVNGGTFLGIMDDQPGDARFFREFDLAGNIIRETNWSQLNQEVNAYRASHHLSPATVTLDFISHEGNRLPNGDTLMMVSEERVANQGQGNVDVLGDIILVLDPNFQVVWAWDSFDWLSITRKALLNNTCTLGQAGCPAVFFNKQPNGATYSNANDWTHANAIALDPSDGNMIISLRHQAWVIKVAYANNGDGHIIWKLGNQGNFSLPAGTPSTEWFNYQHDSEFQSNGLLTLFDNNNLQSGQHSRGQAWNLDQTHLVATPVLNVDLGGISSALGAAQLLSNGNYWFDAGFLENATEAQSSEVTPSGSLVFRDQNSTTEYRTFRMTSMYQK